MQLENIQALLLFAGAAAFTPGPNNLMIAGSGANWGYRRSLPHIMGVALGFPAMFVALALGLMQLFSAWPVLHVILRYAGATYMLYLAFRIATASSIGKIDASARPLSFVEAALFQWVNPKAVMYALSVLSTFTTPGGDFLQETMIIAALLVLLSMTSISTWCLFGMAIGHFLQSRTALRVFNLSMALALVASIALVF